MRKPPLRFVDRLRWDLEEARDDCTLEETVEIYEDLAADGGEESERFAERLAERPDLDPWWLHPIYRDFWQLHRARPQGMMPGGIPLSEIVLHARIFRPADTAEQRIEFIRFIQEMDRVFLDHVALTTARRKPKQ